MARMLPAPTVAGAVANRTSSRAADHTAAPLQPPPPHDMPTVSQPTKPVANQTKHAQAKIKKPPGAVLTRSLYVAGHSRPHPELCPALGARTRLVILVSSAPAHAAARDAVRMTWGHAAQRADVAFAFVLGASPPALRAALDAEDALYGDLVEGRSVDSYSNLTLKTVSMLEWLDTYCPRAPRLLKTDDIFINVPRLLRFAEDPARHNATNTVWGLIRRRWQSMRAPHSKYYVSPAQFPGAVLPDFATGPAYLVAARLGVHRVHAPEFHNRRMVSHGFIAITIMPYHEQFELWCSLLDGKSKCYG